MIKKFLECGKIVTIHGLKGEVRVQPWCDSAEFLMAFDTLYFDQGKTPVQVEQIRPHKNVAVCKFAGIDTPDEAAALRGKVLFVDRALVQLEDGEYFIQDLIGCRVTDVDTGRDYGQVYDVRPTGANDVYYLRDAQGVERLVPAIPEVVIVKEIDAGLIQIRPLEGLFDD